MIVRSTVGQVLADPFASFAYGYGLFFAAKGLPEGTATPCALFEVDEDSDEDESPDEIDGMPYLLELAAVCDVISNAREQKPDATPDEILKALKFYLANDAFIVFPE